MKIRTASGFGFLPPEKIFRSSREELLTRRDGLVDSASNQHTRSSETRKGTRRSGTGRKLTCSSNAGVACVSRSRFFFPLLTPAFGFRDTFLLLRPRFLLLFWFSLRASLPRCALFFLSVWLSLPTHPLLLLSLARRSPLSLFHFRLLWFE